MKTAPSACCRKAESRNHGEGEEGIEPHARCHADRPIGDESHDDRTQRGCETGGDKDRVAVHAGRRQNVGIDEDDVGHRQECRHAGNEFGARGRAVLTQFEKSFKHCSSLSVPDARQIMGLVPHLLRCWREAVSTLRGEGDCAL